MNKIFNNSKDKKTVIGILFIIWGILYFLYKMFFPTSVFDFLGNDFFKYSEEQIAQYKEGLQNLFAILDITLLMFLIIIIILYIIYCKKNKVKVLTNNISIVIFVGLSFHILGLVGISWIFVIIGGILLLSKK